jgi:hypothetical protein
VDVETAPFDFIDDCRMRGRAAYASAKLERGVNPSLDLLGEIGAREFFRKPRFPFMNVNGGCCIKLDIEREVEADDFPIFRILPSDCRISKHPGGHHYYAFLPDGRNIEWEGLGKWSTPEKAKEAIVKYLEAMAWDEAVANRDYTMASH